MKKAVLLSFFLLVTIVSSSSVTANYSQDHLIEKPLKEALNLKEKVDNDAKLYPEKTIKAKPIDKSPKVIKKAPYDQQSR